jgi:hypothetical protein
MRDAVDACLTRAFLDVPVPEGLAERLLDRLAAERPRLRRSRRWLLAGGGLVAVAASIMLAVWLVGQRGACVSEQGALDEAIQLFAEGFEQPGHSLSNEPAPPAYPISSSVSIRGTSWRDLDNFLGHSGVVYELPGPGGTHAALYVVACENVEGIGSAPAMQPTSNTAGCCASAWQEGGLLYVLVVEGDPSTYRRYLNLPYSPVA